MFLRQILVFAAAVTSMHAAPFFSTLSNGSGNGAIAGNLLDYNLLAQQFTVTTTISITSVDVSLARFGETPAAANKLTFVILDTNGNNVGTVQQGGAATYASGTLSQSFSTLNYAFSTPVTLAPGTYWLELQGARANSSARSGVYWQEQSQYSSTNINGVVTNRDYSSANGYQQDSLMVRFNGTSAVPEPSTCAQLMLGLGLAIVPAVRARRRHGE